MVLVTLASLVIAPFDVDARGGRGGGDGGRGGVGRSGGGRGGAYRGGNVMNRTPSMSRPANRPAASRPNRQVQRPMQRPQMQRPQAQRSQVQRPSAANRTELRNQVNRYAQNRPANIDRQALAGRVQNLPNNRNSQFAQNRQFSNLTSDRIQRLRPESNNWFNRDFFDRHDIDLGYTRLGNNLWRPAAWATLANWGDWGWSTPYYYDDSGYYPVTPAEYVEPVQYSSSTTQTAVAPAPAPIEGDWLPLGVFALANNAQSAAYSKRFIQLAINRSGELAGVLYNPSTDDAKDLVGMVDKDSQRAYWSISNKLDSPIASTGIYNLTEDQTPINVHFSDGSDQTWALVRLQQEQQ